MLVVTLLNSPSRSGLEVKYTVGERRERRRMRGRERVRKGGEGGTDYMIVDGDSH